MLLITDRPLNFKVGPDLVARIPYDSGLLSAILRRHQGGLKCHVFGSADWHNIAAVLGVPLKYLESLNDTSVPNLVGPGDEALVFSPTFSGLGLVHYIIEAAAAAHFGQPFDGDAPAPQDLDALRAAPAPATNRYQPVLDLLARNEARDNAVAAKRYYKLRRNWVQIGNCDTQFRLASLDTAVDDLPELPQ
jgi:hypothetical protein